MIINKSIVYLYTIHFIEKDFSKDANVVEIFGSYKDSKPLFQGTSEVELKQELDSAISDN